MKADYYLDLARKYRAEGAIDSFRFYEEVARRWREAE